MWWLAVALAAPEWVWVRPGAELVEEASGGRAIVPDAGVVLELVGEGDGWVRARTVPSEAVDTCFLAEMIDPPVDMTFGVRASDLVDVVTERWEHVYADGSRVVVDAGTPRLPDEYGAAPVIDQVWRDLPPDRIGKRFRPEAALPREGISVSDFSGPVGFGDAVVEWPSYYGDPRVSPDEAGLVHVVVMSGCVAVDVVHAAPPAPDMGSLGLIGSRGRDLFRSPELPVVRAGAAVTWPDGASAGVTRRDTSLWSPTVDGRRVCGPFVLQQLWTVDLCVARSDVRGSLKRKQDAGVGGLGILTDVDGSSR
jgi:hypothetical protein